MNEQIEFGLNKASKAQLAEHLRVCDADFVPPLSDRVKIERYAAKLEQKATRFEAWFDNKLIGLVAAYFNDQEKQCAFITSVSVLRKWTGKGLALQLMKQCIRHAKATDMEQLNLEVAIDNHPAISLYEKNGFTVSKTDTSFVTMNLDLRER